MSKRSKALERYWDHVRSCPSVFGDPDYVELHHFGNRGMSQKCSHWLVVPLTVREHREFHDTGAVKPWTPEETRAAFRAWQAESLAMWLEEQDG